MTTTARKILWFLFIIVLIGLAANFILPKPPQPPQSLSNFLRHVVMENPHTEMRVHDNGVGGSVIRTLTLEHARINESGKYFLVRYSFNYQSHWSVDEKGNPVAGYQTLACSRYQAESKDATRSEDYTRDEDFTFVWVADSTPYFKPDGYIDYYSLERKTPEGTSETHQIGNDFYSNWNDSGRKEIELCIKNGWYEK